MGSFCSKYKMHELKIYRGVMHNDTEEWWKVWRWIALSFQNWQVFDKVWLENLKFRKIYTLMGCFWPKYIMFAKKSTEELYFMILECDAEFEEKLTCGLENDMRNLADFHQSKRTSLFIGRFIQSRKYMILEL